MCAEECQKTILPSSFSKSINSNLQEASKGRVKSQSSPSTFEITVRSAKDLAIPNAIERGVVSQEIPSLTVPSGKVMVIASRGFSIRGCVSVWENASTLYCFFFSYEQCRHRQQPSTCQTYRYGVEDIQEQESSTENVSVHVFTCFNEACVYLERETASSIFGLGGLGSLGLLFNLWLSFLRCRHLF